MYISLGYTSYDDRSYTEALSIAQNFQNSARLELPLEDRIVFAAEIEHLADIADRVTDARDHGVALTIRYPGA